MHNCYLLPWRSPRVASSAAASRSYSAHEVGGTWCACLRATTLGRFVLPRLTRRRRKPWACCSLNDFWHAQSTQGAGQICPAGQSCNQGQSSTGPAISIADAAHRGDKQSKASCCCSSGTPRPPPSGSARARSCVVHGEGLRATRGLERHHRLLWALKLHIAGCTTAAQDVRAAITCDQQQQAETRRHIGTRTG